MPCIVCHSDFAFMFIISCASVASNKYYNKYKARRFGYLPTDFQPLDDLLDASDESLFTSTRYIPQHVLHQLLPPPKQISYNLRSRMVWYGKCRFI